MPRAKAKSAHIASDEDLKVIAQVIVEQAQKYAPTKRLKTSGAITATIKEDGTGYKISFVVDRNKAPEARAYEYGSGIHSQRAGQSKFQLGPRGPILIKPNKKEFLAFPWEKADVEALRGSRINQLKKMRAEGTPLGGSTKVKKNVELPNYPSFAGELSDGRLLFNWVKHPGVNATNQGQGYLGLALGEQKELAINTIASGAQWTALTRINDAISRINKTSRRFTK